MQLRRVGLTVERLGEAARYYREVLELPVTRDGDEAVVEVGRSALVLRAGPACEGVHHVAFGIAPAAFEAGHAWLRERVELLTADGSPVIEGPDGWDSRSLYFLGPEGIVLEHIAREADRDQPPGPPSCISEVGIAVPDVPAAVARLGEELGLPPFPPQGAQFAPVGGHDGLLIVVQQDRTWFPTDGLRAPRGPVDVVVAGPRPGVLALTPQATVRSA